MTLQDCFELADVLVSDISSVVTDFLYTERPIITTNPIGLREEDFRTMFPTQSASYVLGPDFTQVGELVDRALGEDPLADARRRTKRYVLGDLPDGPIHAFDENVERICEHARSDAERIRNTFMLPPAGERG
jgi:CDP-glycerol glycerophosphotransferase (TagB/SpsB family)